ncbi:MAG: oxalate/formate MFS antiporter [Xanthobacteraceae bacterium]|nr:oxalate/formate MFS antiporter [Xanthobacteraceae bacterium]
MAAIIHGFQDDSADAGGPTYPVAPTRTRVFQLIVGILCITMVANLQYGWTLFVLPMDQKFHWGRPAIQVAFTIFVLAESWLLPICGWLVDKRGPAQLTFIAGLMTGGSWMLNSVASELWELYVASAIGGLGVGIVVAAGIGNALKWFPNRRGLAAGLTSGAFGVASAITIIPLQTMIAGSGYEHTFFWFGLFQGLGLLILSFVFRAPRRGEAGVVTTRVISQAKIERAPHQVVRTPVFWVMYAVFVLVCTGGLMATAQLAPIAHDLGLEKSPVTILWLSLPALTFALSLDRMLNGVTRPFFGWISDIFGRENTMFVAFLLEGCGIWALSQYGSNPVAFVLLTGLVFFAWGEIYSLFPALTTDVFGAKNAAGNYGLIFTAKGTASLLVPLGNILAEHSGGWHTVFWLSCAMDVAAACIILFIFKPMRISAQSADDNNPRAVDTPISKPAMGAAE